MINIGILGPGNIAKRVAKGVNCSDKAALYAVASRDDNKAKKFAAEYGAEKAYGSYAEMLQDPKVDLVYICTPNAFHEEQIRFCFEYGKHVICEKPMVQSEEKVKELFAKARECGCFLMEAEKTMFTPLNQKLKQMIAEGIIGKLLSIKAEYSNDCLADVSEEHWVLDGTYGGCAGDIGVYPISFSHYFADADMRDLKVQSFEKSGYSCNFGMQADIVYENGIYAFLQSHWFFTPENKGCAILAGEAGYIEVPAYWKGNKAYLHKDGKTEEIIVEMESDFEGEITHAAECVSQGLLESPVLGETKTLEIVKIVEKANHKGKLKN